MPSQSLSILCVDDEPGLAALVGTYLERFDPEFDVTAVRTARQALVELADDRFDCIVSDYEMPGIDGLALLETVRAEYPSVPFIIYTGHGSEGVASDAISAGVTDYVEKTTGTDQYRSLARRIRTAAERYRQTRGCTPAEAGTVSHEEAVSVLETTPDPVVVTVDTQCVYANPRAVALLDGDGDSVVGASLDTLFGQTPASTLPTGSVGKDSGPDHPEGTPSVTQERLEITADDREQSVEAIGRPITWDGDPATVHVLREDGPTSTDDHASRQSLMRAAVEANPDGILVTAADRQPVTYNDQFLDHWDLPEEALASTDGEMLFETMGDHVAVPETFRTHVETQYDDPATAQRTLVRLENGTVLDQYSVPVEAGDDPHGHIWFFRDITDLQSTGGTTQDVFDRMTDAVLAIDQQWRLTFFNSRAEQLLQREADDLLGTEVWSAFPDAVETEVYDRYHEAMETGERVSFEIHYEPLDTTLDIRAYPSETGLTVYFRDVTEARQTKAELRAAVDALQELYTIASDRTLSFETKQDELLALGSSYLDIPFGFVTEIDGTQQRITASVGTHDLLQPGESCPLEESYCRKTITTDEGFLAVAHAGESGWDTDTAYEVFGLETYIGGRVVVNDELYGTVCFASDAPHEREFSEMERTFVEVLTRWLSYELEQRTYRSQLEATNEQLEEFASVVSHDLRNPLSVAGLRLELAREDRDSDHLAAVAQAHDRMETLIEDILTLAREGDVVDDLVAVDLADLVETCWDHVETGAATVIIDTGRQLVADERRLVQLVENLVRNAVEHGGADVTVTVGDLPDGFYVADDGVGLPADQRSQLFDSGHSTKSDGTGIGLRIVQKVADAHGWDVAVTDSAAGGARFEITGVDRP
jgi:nitrogen-specific signal transduction histidine kinase/FixJ family two-component response regulator